MTVANNSASRQDPKKSHAGIPGPAGPSKRAARGRGQDAPWRVFLSHTSDLHEHPANRSFVAAAVDAIIRAGHALTDMAYFAPTDIDPAAQCRNMLSRADVYVGIVGHRHGTRVRGASNLSYTELEFKTATELGLPRLVFLIPDDAPLLPPVRQPTTHANRQAAFRRRLKQAGVTIARTATPAELELRLFQALVELRTARA